MRVAGAFEIARTQVPERKISKLHKDEVSVGEHPGFGFVWCKESKEEEGNHLRRLFAGGGLSVFGAYKVVQACGRLLCKLIMLCETEFQAN